MVLNSLVGLRNMRVNRCSPSGLDTSDLPVDPGRTVCWGTGLVAGQTSPRHAHSHFSGCSRESPHSGALGSSSPPSSICSFVRV